MTSSSHSRLRRSLELAQRPAALIVFALLVACQSPNSGPPGSQPATGVWSMFRGDLARDGHPRGATLSAAGAARLAFSWRGHLDAAIDGTPAVARGMVVVGSAGGTLTAFDALSGRTIWSKHDLGAIASSPAVDGTQSVVFVGTLTGRLYAFGLLHGDPIWQWTGPPDSALWASPVAYQDEVIIGVASPYGDVPLVAGRLVGLDASTGRPRWTTCVRAGCQPGDGLWSTPAIDSRGVAFVGVGNPDDGVLAIDPLTGTHKWLTSLYPDNDRDLDVGATPVIFTLDAREVVAQATVEGMFAVLDATTGNVVWSKELVRGTAVHGLIASPAFDGTHAYAGSASPPTAMFALKPSDGSPAWRYDVAEPIYSAPATGRGIVIFGTGAVFGDLKAGSVVALSSSDGHRLWSYDTHSAVRSGPALAGDLVVVGDSAGDLMAFRPKS
ncbi:MAG: hypothetical protein E6J06_10965 [Chloroflexi bacterium]|nr:MAG: hypothetical protein E6J06_10965 [Chloroflexota bacterium]